MERQLDKLPSISLYNLTRCISLKPPSKVFSKLLKLDKLNLFTDVPSRKSLYPQREIFPGTTEHDVPHLLVRNRENVFFYNDFNYGCRNI